MQSLELISSMRKWEPELAVVYRIPKGAVDWAGNKAYQFLPLNRNVTTAAVKLAIYKVWPAHCYTAPSSLISCRYPREHYHGYKKSVTKMLIYFQRTGYVGEVFLRALSNMSKGKSPAISNRNTGE